MSGQITFKQSNQSPVKYPFVPGEIIKPGTDLALEFADKLDIDSETVQYAVGVHQYRKQSEAAVTLGKDSRSIHVSTDKLHLGTHQIEIGHLYRADGQTVCEPTSIPVTIGAFKGTIPDTLRVEHVVYGALDEFGCRRLKPGAPAPDGCQYVEFIKCVDRKTCAVKHLAFDQNGNQVDADKRLSEIADKRRQVYGNLHPSLKQACDDAEETLPLDVIIIPRLGGCVKAFTELRKDPKKPTLKGYKDDSEAAYFEKVKDARNKVLSRVDQDGTVDQLAKDADLFQSYFIHARITVKHLRQLSQAGEIGGIFLKNTTGIPDLSNSLAISRATQAQAPPFGLTGNGVDVAVYEEGPKNTDQLVFESKYTPSPPDSWHARLTSGIIKNIEPNSPHGYAPNCRLHSANSWDLAAVDWAVRTQGCTVVSQSFHRDEEETSGTLSFDDIFKDWLAIHAPYPTIVHASGNDDPQNNTEYVNHKGFNTISVGSHVDDARTMVASSTFVDPISPHGDRELPEIAANGDDVSAVGERNGGTSFAAPAVAGTVALLQEADPTLRSWPEGNRAILFASADRNVSGGTWWADVQGNRDGWDGAGALNAENACNIAKSRVYPNTPGTASQLGWDVNTLRSTDFGPDTLVIPTWRHYIKVPNPPLLLWRYTVKVALAFSSTVTPDASVPVFGGSPTPASDLNINLDLIIRDSAGNQVANSSSFDNSYEICEFAGRRGETYEILIRRNSGTRDVFVGIAWGAWGRINILNPIPPPGPPPRPNSIPQPSPGPFPGLPGQPTRTIPRPDLGTDDIDRTIEPPGPGPDIHDHSLRQTISPPSPDPHDQSLHLAQVPDPEPDQHHHHHH